MADPSPAPNESDAPKDEYPLAQAKDTPGGEGRLLPPLPEPQVPEIDTGHKEKYQFTLSELLWLMVGVSLFLSALSSAGSFLPGGMTPALLAGFMGLTAFAAMLILALFPTQRAIVKVGWLVLVVLYLATCVVSLFGRR